MLLKFYQWIKRMFTLMLASLELVERTDSMHTCGQTKLVRLIC